ncbi:hypothetical protein [Natrinema longum]|uniref:Uncharacterized protein n=1 Tax=Natrinema longum TaxID=370324 RepID=A0A8A2U7T6_9EURY|nr:hypothetical protein [Natrinema longum]MBZ6493783.1 hypothetical protein [Natrinema longum]QSW84879.1 hypothetical protein J0X27_15725 [Natrinema longum]
MGSDSLPAELLTMGEKPSTIPVLVGVGLGIGSAVLYILLKVGYGSGSLDVAAYDFWAGVHIWGSIAAGIGLSTAMGYAGASVVRSVSLGIIPVVGLITGSAITVVGGLGRYDSSPVVLGIGLLLGSGVLCGAGWLIGYAVRWQLH